MGLFQRALVQPLHEQQLAPINSHATFVAVRLGPPFSTMASFTTFDIISLANMRLAPRIKDPLYF
jgi:hypothetical protein